MKKLYKAFWVGTILLTLAACQTAEHEQWGVKPKTPLKFQTKQKTIHEPIVIDKPGIYDFKGVMHTWKGAGSCGFFATEHPAIIEIHADNVTVKNFGFKDSIFGIRIVDEGKVRKNIRLINIEGYSCFKGISFPDNITGLYLENVNMAVWRGE